MGRLNLWSPLAAGRLAVVLIVAIAPLHALAVSPGELVVDLHGAHAKVPFADGFGWNQQDFYTIVQFPGDPPIESGWSLGYDDVSWDNHSVSPPTGLVARHTVSRDRRFHYVTVQLWDDDDGMAGNSGNDDKFDVNPGAPDQLDIQFDACTMQWTANGIFDQFGPGTAYPGFGNGPPNDRGRVDLEITTGDGLPFTPDKLTVVGLDAVQAAFDPKAIVSGKSTAIRVRVANTFQSTVSAPLTVEIHDGLNGNGETRTIAFPVGITTYYFFDGVTGHEPPFVPTKPLNVSRADLVYSAEIALQSQAPAGTPVDLLDCYLMRNGLFDKSTPIVRTVGPKVFNLGESVVFQPFDFIDTPFAPPASQVASMADTDEAYRKQIWPAATTPHFTIPLPNLAPPPIPYSFFPEPGFTIFTQSILASVFGYDRLVLVTHKGWFQSNVWRPNIWNGGAIGMSLGEFGPHAVIAEYGYKAVSTHELGHTYKLSPHTCNASTPNPWNLECRDEYNYTPTIMGNGLDVEGSVFPSGASTTGCPAGASGSREVCLPNIMNTQDVKFVNWIDTFSYNYMLDALQDPRDPELINLSGAVVATNGLVPPGPPIFVAHLGYSYHFDGAPDIPDPRTQSPPSDTTGGGKFAMRLVSLDGSSRTYRFTPFFSSEGSATAPDGASFSFNVEWDPALRTIELYAPSDALAPDCDSAASCGSHDVLIASRTRTDFSPQVSVLRAGRDIAPSLTGALPPVPTIGPGHQAVLAWDATDVDSPELHAAVALAKVDPAGGPGPWIPIRAEHLGNQLVLLHSQLTFDPGDYIARVVISDGFNSASLTSGTVMRVCNLTNQGAEICDGIDNDCDGTIDNALPPPGSIGLSVSQSAVSWSAVPSAERYDLVRGDVATLRSTGGNFTSATQQCVANDTSSTSVPFTLTPPPAGAWWFLARGSNCLAQGTYDEVGAGQIGQRDAEIAASPAACP